MQVLKLLLVLGPFCSNDPIFLIVLVVKIKNKTSFYNGIGLNLLTLGTFCSRTATLTSGKLVGNSNSSP